MVKLGSLERVLACLPGFSRLTKRWRALARQEQEVVQSWAALEVNPRQINQKLAGLQRLPVQPHSVDEAPWRHPYLTKEHLVRFRSYSQQVWRVALDHADAHPTRLSVAFLVNMAQNMYKWGCMATRHGARAELFLHTMDNTALNCPEWEEFDGEYDDVMDAAGFLARYPGIPLEIPCHRVPFAGEDLLSAYQEFIDGRRRNLLRLLAEMPGLRHEVLLAYRGFYPYTRWAVELGRFDVLYAASSPFGAYASGRPYCVFAVGGDLQIDCGRGDDYGRAMVLAFNAARFLMISNPHALGHSRRLGLTNGVYLPYSIDDERYSPGEGLARKDWEAQYGKGVYVLTTARIDSQVKGFGSDFIESILEVAKLCSGIRFLFLTWGKDSGDFRRRVEASPMRHQFVFLRPVGKRRLVDYYRSADVVLDQLVYGYYGSTALEAASIGKPVVMRLRTEQYSPLYGGDVMPAMNVANEADIIEALTGLCRSPDLRARLGDETRRWLVRNHGRERTMPVLMALLRLTADRVALPKELANPLADPLSEEESAYHARCLVPPS